MKKSVLIKFIIILAVTGLSYSVFWFFKAGQSEKQINKFITENSANISSGEVIISGFPISQKITINDLKVLIPVNLVSKRQIHIKKLEATSNIFSDDFSVALIDGVKVQDIDNNGEIYDVEYSASPEISLSLSYGTISKLSYKDSGFKIVDAEKNVINSSLSSEISIDTTVDEADKKVSKVHISLKQLDGYTIVDFYKNFLEKRVVEGIKTEEIKVNNTDITKEVSVDSATLAGEAVANSSEVEIINSAEIAEAKSGVKKSDKKDKKNNKQKKAKDGKVKNPENAKLNNELKPTPSKNGIEVAQKVMNEALNIATNGPNSANNDPVANSNNPQQQANPALPVAQAPQGEPLKDTPIENQVGVVANDTMGSQEGVSDAQNGALSNSSPDSVDSDNLKSDLVIDLVITHTPTVKKDNEISVDPTQIQELPVQYTKDTKIENLEFSNSQYKINISGDLANSSDDNLPYGGITVKIEKIANLLQQIKSQFKKLAELNKPSSLASSLAPNLDVGVDSPATVQSNQVQNYDVFLNNVSEKINDIAIEIAQKNSVTKEDISQFDIRREKNLEFLVNEVPLREIIGKF